VKLRAFGCLTVTTIDKEKLSIVFVRFRAPFSKKKNKKVNLSKQQTKITATPGGGCC
jgi:hypothetical protein